MRRFFVPIAVASICLATGAHAAAVQAPAKSQPDEAAKLAEARAIAAIISPPADRERTLDALMPKLIAQFKPMLPSAVEADPGLKAIIEDEIKAMAADERPVILKHMPDQVEANAVAYTHEFSLAELKAIHAFAETPTGQHYFSHVASLMGDPAVAKANSALFVEIHQLTEAHKAELKDKLIAYVTAHPEVAAKLKAAEQSK